MRFNVFFVMLAMAFLMAGCGAKYSGNVDSLCSMDTISGKTYVILSGDKNVSSDDLQFREFATYVARAFNAKGMRPARQGETADVAFFLTYGISQPKTGVDVDTVPVYGVKGYDSHTTGTLNSYGSTGYYSGNTRTTARRGIVGYRKEETHYTYYTRYIYITGYDLKEYVRSKKEVQVMQASVTSDGSSGDFRKAFPVLIAGAIEHLGTNTGERVKFSMYEEGDEVHYVKGLPVD